MQQGPVRRGDIYWATYTFPHEQGVGTEVAEIEKQRPVLIVQNDADNQDGRYPLVQAAPMRWA
jgi:mRNA-degrading endonuclease toxin of MazEF toxin-antitoxin module